MDTKSPDHAGLRSDVRLIVDPCWQKTAWGETFATDGLENKIVTFGNDCYAAGQAYGVASQEAELATLRKDNAQLNADVNRLATQERELKAQLETMKYWMAIDKCDCDTERKDGHTVRMDYPKSLELDWHLEDCAYFSCLRQLLAG